MGGGQKPTYVIHGCSLILRSAFVMIVNMDDLKPGFETMPCLKITLSSPKISQVTNFVYFTGMKTRPKTKIVGLQRLH